MWKISSIISLFIIIESINSKSIEQDDCPACKFDDDFNPSTGYGCFRKPNNETICTCPDHQLSTVNQPCRICNRKNICGTNGLCSEKFLVSNRTNERDYFACFCQSDIFVMNDKCSNESSQTISPTRVPRTSTTKTTVFMDTTTTSGKNSTTPACGNNSSKFNRFIEPVWIILLNLVYFLNK